MTTEIFRVWSFLPNKQEDEGRFISDIRISLLVPNARNQLPDWAVQEAAFQEVLLSHLHRGPSQRRMATENHSTVTELILQGLTEWL